MKPGSFIIVPPRSYVNFYPDLRYGNSERILGNQTMLTLPGHFNGGWVQVLLSDKRIGYICAAGYPTSWFVPIHIGMAAV